VVAVKFKSALVSGVLLRRYKRFLADVDIPGAGTITVHCPNTGSMMGCCDAQSPVWLSRSASAQRKYPFTWEIVQAGAAMVGINTGITSGLVHEAIDHGVIGELAGYTEITREVPYGTRNSRVDLLLRRDDGGRCYVEIKNVTAAVDDGVAVFPDAVSSRGTKHLEELMTMVDQGHRAVLCFCVQRDDVNQVQPADTIDPLYGRTLRTAVHHGVEVIAYCARVTTGDITLYRDVPVVCP
jgi:sugar fermentation stimulation protein A